MNTSDCVKNKHFADDLYVCETNEIYKNSEDEMQIQNFAESPFFYEKMGGLVKV